MEKRGVIQKGVTPPEPQEKQASEPDLEAHPAKRLADEVEDSVHVNQKQGGKDGRPASS
jgi:hypothetical protein